MTQRSDPLPTCPDCGGLLQPTEPEQLTSAEVAGADPDDPTRRRGQCLICGYLEPVPAGIG